MYQFISRLLDFILVKMAKSLYVIGKENIPKDNKYVVTCTHESYNEVIMLGMALVPNEIHYMAKKELFNNKWFGQFLTSLNAFPVDRENPGPSTLKRPVNLLKENEKEYKHAKKVLSAAAMTYVAATATAVAELVRIILIAKASDN